MNHAPQGKQEQLIQKVMAELKSTRLVLPSLPELALKINREIDSPAATIARVAKVISVDPAVMGKLLQVANSAMYGGLQKVENIEAAIKRLGFDSTRHIVISLTLNKTYEMRGIYVKKHLARQWSQATKVAALSKVIGENHTDFDPHECMLGGLLHNIGTLPIIAHCANKRAILVDKMLMERIFTSLQHKLGAWVIEQWGLNERLRQVPLNCYHFTDDEDHPLSVADVVTVALLHNFRGAKHPFGEIPWTEVKAFQRLNLTPKDSIKAMELAHQQVEDVQSLLGLSR
jgi:HD-like signal output (HDOD) protein